jgi:hypothetical protein
MCLRAGARADAEAVHEYVVFGVALCDALERADTPAGSWSASTMACSAGSSNVRFHWVVDDIPPAAWLPNAPGRGALRCRYELPASMEQLVRCQPSPCTGRAGHRYAASDRNDRTHIDHYLPDACVDSQLVDRLRVSHVLSPRSRMRALRETPSRSVYVGEATGIRARHGHERAESVTATDVWQPPRPSGCSTTTFPLKERST